MKAGTDPVRARDWPEAKDFPVLGIFAGLVTGAAEVLLRLIAASGHPTEAFLNENGIRIIWMGPVGAMIMFGALGVLVGLAATVWRGDGLPRVALILFVGVAAFTFLLHYDRLHVMSSTVLSLGVGVVFGEVLSRHRDRLHRAVRIITWPSVVLLVAIAFAFRVSDAVVESRAVSSLPPALLSSPNLLFIVVDVGRAADMSLYGYARPTTPNLDSLAKSSVVFDRATSTAPWTLPSHASIFTGRYPHELSADWRAPLDDTYRTLAEVLSDRGYITGGFVANRFYGAREFGLGRGFQHYESRRATPSELIATSRLGRGLISRFNQLSHSYYMEGRMNASEINRRVLRWLPSERSRPFFVFVNYFDAHDPYLPPSPYDRKFLLTEPSTRAIHDGVRHTAEELRGMRAAYDGAIAYVDWQLNSLLRELQRRGDLSNTLVIVTADHGEEFGEHGWVNHGNGLHYPSVHVPLLISFPGRVPGGVRVAEPVTLRDLPATALDLLGIAGAGIPGRSLALHWERSPITSREGASPLLSELKKRKRTLWWYALSKGDMRSIIVGRYQYIRNGDGREELYDVVTDPWETVDLTRSAGHPAILDTARNALESALKNGPRSTAPAARRDGLRLSWGPRDP